MRRLLRLIWRLYPRAWRDRFAAELEADLARVDAGRRPVLDALDPAALAGALAVISLIWAAATWHPARRASRTDPADALRT